MTKLKTANELLLMLIKDAYSASGKPSKATTMAMMAFVYNDAKLQVAVNNGDNKSILNHDLSDWISVDDELPKEDGRYLIVGHSGQITTRHFCVHHDNTFFGNVVATHWQPLPQPPKQS